MNKVEIRRIYDAAKNNESITDADSLAKHLGVTVKEASSILRDYSHIRDRVRANRIKAGAGGFNNVMRMWKPTSAGQSCYSKG